jgi:hypothetical protein
MVTVPTEVMKMDGFRVCVKTSIFRQGTPSGVPQTAQNQCGFSR